MKTIEIKNMSGEQTHIEIEFTLKNKNFLAYLQLPDCPDSQHHIYCDDEEINDEKLLAELLEKIDDNYTKKEQSIIEITGLKKWYEENDSVVNPRYYVIVDQDDRENVFYLAEHEISDYYNTFLLRELSEEEEHDSGLQKRLDEIKQEIIENHFN